MRQAHGVNQMRTHECADNIESAEATVFVAESGCAAQKVEGGARQRQRLQVDDGGILEKTNPRRLHRRFPPSYCPNRPCRADYTARAKKLPSPVPPTMLALP